MSSEPRRSAGPQRGLIFGGVALLGALLFTSLVLLSSSVNPLEAYRLIFLGSFSSPIRMSDMVMLGAPLILCSAGLTLTFAAGLYNLGIEGQMIIGAVAAMLPLRLLSDLPVPLLWLLAFACGAAGGAAWALLAGGLRIGLRVNEIFAGLGLNFLASGIALYLVLGPWRRVGQASSSGTQPLPTDVWLPTLDKLRLAPAAPIIALLALALIWFAVTRTRWGLELRAVGMNPQAAGRMGIPATRRLAESFAACGAMAGLAGTIQVLGVFHQLIPSISSGIGLLALLVVLLVRANPVWVLPVAAAFAIFTVGSLQMPLALGADSSIAGVLQGAIVLFALLGRGLSMRK
ncbi:inner-membrane translocator [Oscillochloris trichoides DG-6]|uniref:Inner-membrane translocator n=1 Tax=Oscillochloris trichoides DG-6 TaxID=765420 RepID=E1IFU7_9CHLR|nr:ABC transporter permease [Oscillochloris trichoides]EFO79940.1 inner-membrane translocator [Oscillochloris trichoides DG-6]